MMQSILESLGVVEREERGDVKHVVVVGGGYTGAGVARDLDKYSNIRVTLIDRNECMVHKIAGLRAAVDPEWTKAVVIPRDKLLSKPKSRVLVGHVKEIDFEQKKIQVSVAPKDSTQAGMETVEYDYCVISTGAYNGPGEPPAGQSLVPITKEMIRLYYTDVAEQIKAAKSIVIIGGGAVGVEFAGEIKSIYPGKKVTLVHSGEALMDMMSFDTTSLGRNLLQQLKAMDAHVMLGERVEIDLNEFDENGLLHGQRKVKTSKGSVIDADLVAFCAGSRTNNELFPKEMLDDQGLVAVKPTLQSVLYDNVFAVGDVNNVNEDKMFAKGQNQIPITVKNIAQMAKGKAPTCSYAPSTWLNGLIIVPCGPNGGASKLVFFTTGAMVSKFAKSAKLFTNMIQPQYNAPVPNL